MKKREKGCKLMILISKNICHFSVSCGVSESDRVWKFSRKMNLKLLEFNWNTIWDENGDPRTSEWFLTASFYPFSVIVVLVLFIAKVFNYLNSSNEKWLWNIFRSFCLWFSKEKSIHLLENCWHFIVSCTFNWVSYFVSLSHICIFLWWISTSGQLFNIFLKLRNYNKFS